MHSIRKVFAITFLSIFLLGGIASAQWTWTPQTGRFINVKRLPKETPELQVEHARSLMLQGNYKQAMRETEKFVQYYGDTELADENQFLRGEIKLAQGEHLDAAKEFQQVISGYPDTELFDETIAKQYEIGDLLYEKGQKKQEQRWTFFKNRPLKRAAEVYAMVIENAPFTAAAAEAQYKVGLCHYARKEYLNAAFEYRRVIEDYPGSDWVDEASYGLAMCYYERSLPPAYDQTPSQLAVDAIDEFVARYPGDARIEELQENRLEMIESIAQHKLDVAQFYEKRREFQSAYMYYEIVAKDYPGTEAAQAAQEWLSAHPGIETPASRFGHLAEVS